MLLNFEPHASKSKHLLLQELIASESGSEPGSNNTSASALSFDQLSLWPDNFSSYFYIDDVMDPRLVTDEDLEFFDQFRIIVPLLIAICLGAMVLNCVVVLLCCCCIKQPLTATTILTLGLAAADSWASLCVAVGFFVNSYLPMAVYIEISNLYCLVVTFEAFRMGAVITSSLHLLFLAISHHRSIILASKHNQLPHQAQRPRTGLLGTIFCSFLIPPALLLLIFRTVPEQGFNSENCWRLDFFHGDLFRYGLTGVILAPLPITVVLYGRMLFHINILRRRLSFYRITPVARRLRHKKQMLNTSVLFVISFIIGWFPVCICFLFLCSTCSVTRKLTAYPNLSLAIHTTANLLLVLKFALNPLIYALRIPTVKQALRLTAYRWYHRQQPSR